MIRGRINNRGEAVVSMSFLGVDDPIEREALIDTGFSGYASLPISDIHQLQLRWLCESESELADGSIVQFDVFVGEVIWDNQLYTIEIDHGETTPSVGMKMMHGFQVCIDVKPKGDVTIRSLGTN